MLTAAMIAVQAAKKSHAALERNESLKVMTVDPLIACCIYRVFGIGIPLPA
jgi:hypothetical protein